MPLETICQHFMNDSPLATVQTEKRDPEKNHSWASAYNAGKELAWKRGWITSLCWTDCHFSRDVAPRSAFWRWEKKSQRKKKKQWAGTEAVSLDSAGWMTVANSRNRPFLLTSGSWILASFSTFKDYQQQKGSSHQRSSKMVILRRPGRDHFTSSCWTPIKAL